MKNAVCRICNQDFQYAPRKGRPPVKCDPCKEAEVDKPVEREVESQTGTTDWGGPHGIGTHQNHIIFKKDDNVRVSGDNGTYVVFRDDLNKDGSYTLYGGSRDPNGVRGFRAVMPSRLSYDKRKRYK